MDQPMSPSSPLSGEEAAPFMEGDYPPEMDEDPIPPQHFYSGEMGQAFDSDPVLVETETELPSSVDMKNEEFLIAPDGGGEVEGSSFTTPPQSPPQPLSQNEIVTETEIILPQASEAKDQAEEVNLNADNDSEPVGTSSNKGELNNQLDAGDESQVSNGIGSEVSIEQLSATDIVETTTESVVEISPAVEDGLAKLKIESGKGEADNLDGSGIQVSKLLPVLTGSGDAEVVTKTESLVSEIEPESKEFGESEIVSEEVASN